MGRCEQWDLLYLSVIVEDETRSSGGLTVSLADIMMPGVGVALQSVNALRDTGERGCPWTSKVADPKVLMEPPQQIEQDDPGQEWPLVVVQQ
jgi:hypothetical protein